MSGLIQNEPLCVAVLRNMLRRGRFFCFFLMISRMWNISRTLPSRFCVPNKPKTNKSLTQISLKGNRTFSDFIHAKCTSSFHTKMAQHGCKKKKKIFIFTPKWVIIPRKMLPLGCISQYFTEAHEVKLNIMSLSHNVLCCLTCGLNMLLVRGRKTFTWQQIMLKSRFIQKCYHQCQSPSIRTAPQLDLRCPQLLSHSSASDIPHAHCINCRGNAQQSLQADTRVDRARKRAQNQACLRGQEARSAIELIRHCAVRMNNDR